MWSILIALAVLAWLAFGGAISLDGFLAGFIAGGTLIGTLAYLWAWSQRCEDSAQ